MYLPLNVMPCQRRGFVYFTTMASTKGEKNRASMKFAVDVLANNKYIDLDETSRFKILPNASI